jgi:hypothetical protein
MNLTKKLGLQLHRNCMLIMPLMPLRKYNKTYHSNLIWNLTLQLQCEFKFTKILPAAQEKLNAVRIG